MKNKYILLKKFAFDCWHNSTVIHNKQYTTNNTQHKIHSCYIISFETFFGCFWSGGLFELDWFRDRRQLNSLLTVTEDDC